MVSGRRECSVRWREREAVRNVRRVPGNAATQVYSHTSSCRCHEDRRLRLYACDCLSGALCLECTRPTADSGVFMCAVRRQLAPSGRGRVACETSLWNLEPFLGPFHHHRRRDNTAFYPSSEARIVRLLGICAATSAGLMSVIYFIFCFFRVFFLKVAACGALHMIPVWSCWREMDLFCGGVKHEETQKNVNVGGRRDRLCEAFISLQLNNSNVLLGLNKVCLVFFFFFFCQFTGRKPFSASTVMKCWNNFYLVD